MVVRVQTGTAKASKAIQGNPEIGMSEAMMLGRIIAFSHFFYKYFHLEFDSMSKQTLSSDWACDNAVLVDMGKKCAHHFSSKFLSKVDLVVHGL